MSTSWQLLRDGGVPLATPGVARAIDPHALADAARAVIALAPHGRDAEALAAWLLAWAHHWPDSFATHAGAALATWARGQLPDANRYLKLRRIAIENLAGVL